MLRRSPETMSTKIKSFKSTNNFKSTKCIDDLPTCVTDHPLDDDVHEEAVVVRGVDLLHHVLSHLNRFMIEKPHNSQKGEHVAI